MISLDLMSYKNQLKIQKQNDQTQLFDPIRKKWILLQPEELVRQLLLQYLLLEKDYNKNRIKVEKGLQVNELFKRCDILIYTPQVQPWLLIECKRPEVPIDQSTFRQIATYNLPLQVPYLVVSNGLQTHCCEMNYPKSTYTFLEEFPEYPDKL